MRIILMILATLPATLPLSGAAAFQPQECLQDDSHVLALRACTALLDATALDATTRASYQVRRGYAWLADEDGADAAVADFTAALKVVPANLKALKGRAKAQTMLGAHTHAAADWSAVLAAQPGVGESAQALMERGSAFFAGGRHRDALADYANALELDPRSETARLARAAVFEALGERESVLKEYELALSIRGGSYEVYLWRGQLAERWGQPDAAIGFYTSALKIDPRRAWEARKSLQRLGIDSPSE